MKYTALLVALLLPLAWPVTAAEPVLDYSEHIAPILTKYCAGCHNEDEANGDFSLADFASMSKGGESGPALTPGSAASSRMIQMLIGKLDPMMPPEDEPRPTAAEIKTLSAWVDGGAQGPANDTPGAAADELVLHAAKIQSASDHRQPITALALAPNGRLLAIARFESIELWSGDGTHQVGQLSGHPGKVNSVTFSPDGRYLLAGTGISGLGGRAFLWRVADQKVVRQFAGHHDILYAAIISPDGRLVATAGYDKRILISDFDTGEILSEIDGHNGAVYDLAFDPSSELISSASADATVKVWQVADGARLDTRSEPLKEQYTTAISPDASLLVGGGADNRIRVWELVSRTSERINPLRFARFAHEGAIELIRFSHDGQLLISVGRDGFVKAWDSANLRQVAALPQQDVDVAAVTIAPDDAAVVLGRMDGTFEVYPLEIGPSADSGSAPNVTTLVGKLDVAEVAQGEEQEPNNSVDTAHVWPAPFEVSGHIHSPDTEEDAAADTDLFRFHSDQGQTWIVTVNASRDKSKLDSKIEILDDQGRPIPRVLLQAVRDSYFTFRGKDSQQTGDFRIHSWEEMSLNQLLYCNGEVVKLYHYPRGPDSGFNVYPNFGQRHTFFDTPALAHALHEPCYIVEPHPPGSNINANGLPTFTVYYENDDDSHRELGTDSRLTFVAPKDGDYIVRLRDVRGFHGDDFHYRLSVQVPKPSFAIRTIHGENPSVPRGSGRKFGVEIDRIDGFRGPVDIYIENLPAGLSVPGPLTIEPDHFRVWARLEATADAPDLTDETKQQVIIRAVANVGPRQVEQTRSLGEIKLEGQPKLLVRLSTDTDEPVEENGLPVITLVAGQTTTARLEVRRDGYDGRVSFGNEEAAMNQPHGVYVDNIGLNGVLIPEGNTERVFFITAEPWVKPQDRLIYLEASEAGRPTSNPAILRIVRRQS